MPTRTVAADQMGRPSHPTQWSIDQLVALGGQEHDRIGSSGRARADTER